MPTLNVIFQDGSEHTYTLNILTLMQSPLTWIIIVLALLVIFRIGLNFIGFFRIVCG